MTKWDLKNLCKHKWKYVFVLNLSFWQNQSKLNSRDSVGIRKKWTLKFYSLMEDVIQRKKKVDEWNQSSKVVLLMPNKMESTHVLLSWWGWRNDSGWRIGKWWRQWWWICFIVMVFLHTPTLILFFFKLLVLYKLIGKC